MFDNIGDEREVISNISYLDDEELRNLSTYKYHGIDLSIVTKYVFEPFWNFLVDHVIPVNVSANSLSLCGLICNLVSLIWCLISSGFATHPASRWIYPIIALLNSAYQHLDGVDGKQARKTGTASPLGQIFDHGVDALCSGFHTIIVVIALEAFDTWIGLLTMIISPLGFSVYTYEEYNTRVLRLDRFSAPVEGLLIMQAVLLLVGIFGIEIFKKPLFKLGFRYPLSIEPFEDNKQPISSRDLLLNMVVFSGILMIIDSIIKTYRSLKERIREEDEYDFLSKQKIEGTVAEETDLNDNGVPVQVKDKLVKYCQEKYRDTPIIGRVIGIERYSAPEGVVPKGNPLVYLLKHFMFVLSPYLVILVTCILGTKRAPLASILLYNISFANLTLRIILGRLCGMTEAEMVMPFYKKGKWHTNMLIEFLFPILTFISILDLKSTRVWFIVGGILAFFVLLSFVIHTVRQVSSFLGIPILGMRRKD